MKILYLILPLWFLVGLPLFVQNSIFPAKNQFETYKQAQSEASPKRQKNHRGSGRRNMKVNKS